MPLLSAEAVEEVDALLPSEIAWKPQFAGIERFAQEGQEFASEFRPEDPGGQQKTCPCIAPVPLRCHSAAGD